MNTSGDGKISVTTTMPANLGTFPIGGGKVSTKFSFQNTGNSYATRIVITDTLTENVDASTLEFLSSSVPFVMNVVDRKHFTWTAANTYLPDSIADEANSHGYISFRIKITYYLFCYYFYFF